MSCRPQRVTTGRLPIICAHSDVTYKRTKVPKRDKQFAYCRRTTRALIIQQCVCLALKFFLLRFACERYEYPNLPQRYPSCLLPMATAATLTTSCCHGARARCRRNRCLIRCDSAYLVCITSVCRTRTACVPLPNRFASRWHAEAFYLSRLRGMEQTNAFV